MRGELPAIHKEYLEPQLEGIGFTTQFLREVQTKGTPASEEKFIVIEFKRIGFTTQFLTEVPIIQG
jgi:hypothetical protein